MELKQPHKQQAQALGEDITESRNKINCYASTDYCFDSAALILLTKFMFST